MIKQIRVGLSLGMSMVVAAAMLVGLADSTTYQLHTVEPLSSSQIGWVAMLACVATVSVAMNLLYLIDPEAEKEP